ncbi:taste receptor type 2 member 40-like [Spea bombifrons]|uniref:taste receptor type 2 member 40-like n=1 Tax=Spea bombifrons TaxID=233779 RepID=UPI002349EC5B|nr:taste receptor type 2 member 40-like [Spea bombifrons]
MSSATTWALTAAQILTYLMGLAANGFVLKVSFVEWMLSGHVTSSDYFICCLAFSNIFLQTWFGADWVCDLLLESGPLCRMVYALKMMSCSYSLLLSSWLCVFYCVRIVSFQNGLLRLIQRNIRKSYKYVIVLSVLLCLAMGLPLAWIGKEVSITPQINSSHWSNHTTCGYCFISIYRSVLLLFGYSMPLFYVILSAAFILRSLTIHMERMRVTMETGHESRVEAHVKAGYTVLSLLLLFALNFILSIIILIDIYPPGHPNLFACYLAITFYSLAHGIVLIRGNRRLREEAAETVRKLLKIKG